MGSSWGWNREERAGIHCCVWTLLEKSRLPGVPHTAHKGPQELLSEWLDARNNERTEAPREEGILVKREGNVHCQKPGRVWGRQEQISSHELVNGTWERSELWKVRRQLLGVKKQRVSSKKWRFKLLGRQNYWRRVNKQWGAGSPGRCGRRTLEDVRDMQFPRSQGCVNKWINRYLLSTYYHMEDIALAIFKYIFSSSEA